MRNALKSVFVWAVVGGVCWGAYLWAGGALMDPFLGRVRSDVAGTLQVTSGESVTCTGGTIRGGARHLRVEGEGGAADNVDIITGGVAGDVLWLRPATAGHTLTLRNNVAGGGNILTPDAASYVMPDNGYVQLLCTGASWIAQDGVGTFGDTFGPSSSTDNQVVRFDGATGKLLQASLMYCDDNAQLSLMSHMIGGYMGNIRLGGTNGSGPEKTYVTLNGIITDTTPSSEDSTFIIQALNNGSSVTLLYFDKTVWAGGPCFPTGLQAGYDSTDGFIRFFSEQGATDRTAIVYPNASMTSNANFYLPADEPAAESWLTMGTDGIIDYTTIASETLTAVSARGETFAADAILPSGGKLKFAGGPEIVKADANTLRIQDAAATAKAIHVYSTTAENSYNFLGGGQYVDTTGGLTGGTLGYFNTTGNLNFNDSGVGYWSKSQVYAYGDHYSTTDADNFAAGVRIDPWDRVAGVSTMRTGVYIYSDGSKACITLPTLESNLVLDSGYTVTVGGVNALYSVDTEYFNAGAWIPNTTNGPTAGTLESTTNLVMDDGFWFDPSTNQTAQVTGRFPEKWNCGPIRLQIESKSDCANESDVVWEFAGLVRRNGSTWDSAFGETVQIVDTHAGAGKVNVATSGYMTFAGTPQPGDVYKIRITRNAATAADTFNESMLATGLTPQFGESPIASHIWP